MKQAIIVCEGQTEETIVNKVLHGQAVSSRIGLSCIRAECRHFHKWLKRLESLPPLIKAE